MITRISKENADKYTLLFDKASAFLGLDNSTDDKRKILSLNDYYAHLKDLKNLNFVAGEDETEEDVGKKKSLEAQQRIFLRLPLDEDVFEINADTRTIAIPSDFSKNGVSVQSDEMSEILYFVIDRYYDTADLAANDVNIAIQWQAKNSKGETIEGVTKNFGKDIESIPGKVIFGWPISSRLTAAAGNISFAVRFYTVDNDHLVYSFSTIPATVSVKGSLAYDLVNGEGYEAIDYADIILGRITSDGIYDIGAPIPTAPVASALMILSELDPDNDIILSEDLSVPFNLGVDARPTDTSILSAKWKYYPADNALISGGIEGIELDGEESYRLLDAPADLEYYIEDNGQYVKVDKEEYTFNEDHFEHNGEAVEIYVKRYLCNINTANTGAGIYTVTFDASNGLNTMNFDLRELNEQNSSVEVSGPDAPEFANNQPSNHTVLQNRQAMIKILTEESKDRFTYNWFVSDSVDGEYSEIMDALSSKVKARVLPVKTISENQERAYLIQNGTDITLFKTEDLEDVDLEDNVQKWVAIDLDLHVEDITGYKLNNTAMTSEHVNAAADYGLGAGHVIYYIPYNEIGSGLTLNISTLEDEAYETIHFLAGATASEGVSYGLSEDGSELYIYNALTFDKYYKVNVTAHRNRAEEEDSYEAFRVTNAPIKPELYYKAFRNNGVVYIPEADWESKGYHFSIDNRNTVLTVAVRSSIQSDGLKCAWLKANLANDVYDEEVSAYIHDLPDDLINQLGNVLTAAGRQAQFDADNEDDVLKAGFSQITGDAFVTGEGLDTSNNKKYLEASINLNNFMDIADIPGFYYCVVVNELNEHCTTAIGPIIKVVGN